MLWCDSVAPLGNPVVPEVYWMLIGSSQDSVAATSASLVLSAAPPASSSPDIGNHRAVVAGLECRGRHQGPDAGLVEHVGELMGAVRRVDVDEDRADLRGGVLDHHPLRPVRRPDADPVTLRDAVPE